MKNKLILSLVPIIVTFLLIASITTSGLVKVNINHFMHIPLFDDQTVIVREHFSLLHMGEIRQVDVRLDDTINGTDTIKSVLKVLQEADSNTTITFHLAGYGGDVQSLYDLINNIQTTKATVIGIVEAPVHSAHAYLALAMPKLIIAKYSYLMLHSSTILNMDCSSELGTDRGVSNVEHCNAFKTANVALMIQLINDTPLLSNAEREELLSGHDVYILSDGRHLDSADLSPPIENKPAAPATVISAESTILFIVPNSK